MEGVWFKSVQTLVQSAYSDCDHCVIEELENCRGIAERALTQEKHRQRDQDLLVSRKKESERIESFVKQLTPQLDSLKQEETELNLRLNALQTDLIESVRHNEVTKKKVRDLTEEVVDVEHEKENKGKNLKKNFEDLMKVYRTYKKMLDMRIESELPDVYKIWFSSNSTKHDHPDLVLRTTDFRAWEVLDVRGDENLKDQLNDDFVEHRNVQKILLKVRKQHLEPSTIIY